MCANGCAEVRFTQVLSSFGGLCCGELNSLQSIQASLRFLVLICVCVCVCVCVCEGRNGDLLA